MMRQNPSCDDGGMRLVSTKNPSQRATFLEALAGGAAPDGGCFVPEPIACFRDITRLLALDFRARTVEILHRLLGEECTLEELEIAGLDALDFPVALHRVGHRVVALETFHGPSGSYHDFGARLLARLLDLHAARGGARIRTILCPGAAMGAAVAQAFAGHRGTRAVVLLPKARAASVDGKLVAAPGGNVLGYAVDGDLAACRRLADACRADRELADRLNLVVADETHPAWLLAGVLMHFEAVAAARGLGFRDAPVIAVPGGDMGLLAAGLWAKAMGLPVKAFVVGLNANRHAGALLEGGLSPDPVEETHSPEFDVGEPAAWPQVQHFLKGGSAAVRWASLDRAATRQTMWGLHHVGFTQEPHGAVVFGALEERRALAETGIVLAPTHPAKAPEAMQGMNVQLPWPGSMVELPSLAAPLRALPAEAQALKAALLG